MSVFFVLLIIAVFLIVTTPRVRRKKVIAKFDPGKLTSRSSKLEPNEKQEKEGIRLGGEVYWSPTRHPNPHVLIVGGSGSGKTWTIRLLARELLKSEYPCILFDFHGDLGIPEAVTHRISLDSEYGVNPLALSLDPTGGGPDPQRFEVLEQLRNAFKPMGSLQLALLDDCLKSTYRRFGVIQEDPDSWSQDRMPHLGDLQSELDRRIGEDSKNLRAKGLRTKLSLAFDFRIFSKPQVPLPVSRPESQVPGGQVSKVEGRACGTHIDMSKLPPQLQFMTVDSLLKQIFRQQQLGGTRPLSLYLLLDESKLSTPQNKDSPLAALNRIATEGRKFGIGLIVSSQYVGHLPRDVVVNTFTKLLMKTDKTEIAATARRFKVEETQLLCLQRSGQALINFADRFEWKELQVGH